MALCAPICLACATDNNVERADAATKTGHAGDAFVNLLDDVKQGD